MVVGRYRTRVRAIVEPLGYPLHRRSLTWRQRYGRTVGLVASVVLGTVGLLTLLGGVTARSVPSIVVGLALMALAPCVVLLGNALGSVRSASGLVTVQPDRLEITDDRYLPRPVLLLRHEIIAVCSPGLVEAQPAIRARILSSFDVLTVGPERPNVEVWLARPISPVSWPVGMPGRPRRPVAVLQLLTPGAGPMIHWFREGLTELAPTKFFDIEGSRIDPAYDQF